MSELLVNGTPIDYNAEELLPNHMQGEMREYIEERVLPGEFLVTVLAGDLYSAVASAESRGIDCNQLGDFITWLYKYAPPRCFGSTEAVMRWLQKLEDK